MDKYINNIILGDCIGVMKGMPENFVDAIVTDPPYGLAFMDKDWDKFRIKSVTENQLISWLGSGMIFNKSSLNEYQKFSQEWAKEALRVLKPGGYLLAFGGARTFHRMFCGIEDAGFEIRDTIIWLYGSGFPKGLNIAKAIDNFLKTGKANANRTGDGNLRPLGYTKKNFELGYRPDNYGNPNEGVYEITEEEAKKWIGWNIALKPAYEPIVVARKPISENSIAENVLKWGTGGLNIDACRIEVDEPIYRESEKETYKFNGRVTNGSKTRSPKYWENNKGRYPANVVLDEEAAELLDQQTGELKSGYMSPDLHKRNKTEGEYESPHGVYGKFKNNYLLETFGDKGGASRFFYCAKATKKERDRGLEKLEPKRMKFIDELEDENEKKLHEFLNTHPTVKPIRLMKYLVKLVTPPGGIVLDPFAGSGSTLIACKELGINYIGIEKEVEYVEIANLRLNAVPDKIPGL